MRYLVTGHTGFKGAWLTMWLASLGHDVCGLALDPEPGALFEVAEVSAQMKLDLRGDIRDRSVVEGALQEIQPDVLIHMAAQPLVRESYRHPRWTIETNVMGTLNVLEAAIGSSSLKAQVILTTDKVYRNVNQVAGYVETDPLGGDDPYSASKAMADILTQSWIHSFPGPRTAIARAGNVIGGGDVSRDRLFPDIVRSLIAGQEPQLRYPHAVRPWQHVLDCLNGYLTLVDALLAANPQIPPGSQWNFGPDESSFVSVGDVTEMAMRQWGLSAPSWKYDVHDHLHEAGLLALDATKSSTVLGWRNHLSLPESVAWTVEWEQKVARGAAPAAAMQEQVSRFLQMALE